MDMIFAILISRRLMVATCVFFTHHWGAIVVVLVLMLLGCCICWTEYFMMCYCLIVSSFIMFPTWSLTSKFFSSSSPLFCCCSSNITSMKWERWWLFVRADTSHVYNIVHTNRQLVLSYVHPYFLLFCFILLTSVLSIISCCLPYWIHFVFFLLLIASTNFICPHFCILLVVWRPNREHGWSVAVSMYAVAKTAKFSSFSAMCFVRLSGWNAGEVLRVTGLVFTMNFHYFAF